MSVFGSMFTAVSALSAQGQSLGAISTNIANVNTVGYKRTDTAFSSLVTTQSRATIYSPGSVRANQNARIDEQGILQQSTSATDIAISGGGFFVVQSEGDAFAETLYTRAGSFSENSDGVLANTAGFSLMGFPLDQNEDLPPGISDLDALVPVDVGFLGGLTAPTSEAQIALNLDQDENEVPYPVVIGTPADFTRSIRVFDTLGEGQDLTLTFTKHETPTAIVNGTIDLEDIIGPLDSEPNIDNTDQFDITVGGVGPTTITLDGDLGKLLTDLNSIVDIDGQRVLFAETNPAGRLVLKSRNIGADITLADGAGTPLADALGFGGSLGVTPAVVPGTIDFLAPVDRLPNTEGWWAVQFITPSGNIIEEGSINFDGSGQLNAVTDVNGDVNILLDDIDFGNGSDPQDITFNINSFTQFAGEFNVVFSDQNGAELGLRSGVSIDTEGFVSVQFSNGRSTKVYQVPVATFPNVNGLQDISGNVFRETDDSGSFNLKLPGQGGAGLIDGGTLEGSNVDLADEFSKLIITQRAYSASTRVITTADEITADLLRIR